ncbi:hypothetical protein [Streptomyces sp. SID1328]|uniref:hypothetical protein n=1 Tax=Streptomyces sp. SID1328 TaxID=2690250 RepID=UPI001F3460F4|nr:hypothetical protein [Streptomyces sp. SID1328]
MKITIEGASPEFERKLLLLLADHRHELTVTADTEWDVERAMRYLTSLPANALKFARRVVEANGHKKAEELRAEFDGELRGPTIALSRAVPRGVRMGWWPEGTEAPISPLYDPDHPSWQKAIAYTMTSENTPVFLTAFEWLDDGNVQNALSAAAFGGRTVPRASHEAESDNPNRNGEEQPCSPTP